MYNILQIPEHLDINTFNSNPIRFHHNLSDFDEQSYSITIYNVSSGIDITHLTEELIYMFGDRSALLWDSPTLEHENKNDLVDINILTNNIEVVEWIQKEWKLWIVSYLSNKSKLSLSSKYFSDEVNDLKQIYRELFILEMYTRRREISCVTI